MIWLIAACFALLAFIVVLQSYWRERDHDAFAEERQQWVLERRDLNNRIQAPEAAPWIGNGDVTVEEPAPTQHVAFDDDEGYWDAQPTEILERPS